MSEIQFASSAGLHAIPFFNNSAANPVVSLLHHDSGQTPPGH